MQGRDRRKKARRGARPLVEAVESRELLSGITAALIAGANAQRVGHALVLHAGGGTVHTAQVGGTGDPQPTSQFLNPTGGLPTPHEQARQAFRAVFVGPFLVSRGRYSSQATLLSITGARRLDQLPARRRPARRAVTSTDPSVPASGARSRCSTATSTPTRSSASTSPPSPAPVDPRRPADRVHLLGRPERQLRHLRRGGGPGAQHRQGALLPQRLVRLRPVQPGSGGRRRQRPDLHARHVEHPPRPGDERHRLASSDFKV